MKERRHWDEYMDAYEDDDPRDGHARVAPWYVVPADNKWFTRIVVAARSSMRSRRSDCTIPKVEPATIAEFAAAKRALLAEKR